LEIDSTQIKDFETLMKDKNILLNPLHFKQTSSNIKVGYNLPIYPPIPNDWYLGPNNPIHVHEID